MKKMIAIGEVLIDLTQTGVNESGIPQYSANPGGAPANVAVAVARLGQASGFIGCVGQDAFGSFLRKTLLDYGVEDVGLIETADAPTTLAVVSVDAAGERSFQFYRKPGADLCLSERDLDLALLDTADILHFGSVSLTDDPSRSATLAAASYARQSNKLVSYDPNYRANLWPDKETAVQRMRAPVELADIIKISEEETELLTGYADPAQAAAVLADKGVKLVLVTLGANGVLYRWQGIMGTVAGFPVQVADTNGAGDTFLGAVLSRILQRGGHLNGLTEMELQGILRMANCAAALTCSRPGAIPAMPTCEQVHLHLAQYL